MTALSRHMSRYPHARPSSLRDKAAQDKITAMLAREMVQRRRQKHLERIKRVLRWPAYVWRW